MTIPIHVVAHNILQHKDAGRITPLQLIKLAYLTHGWHLAFFDKPLFSDQVEAWPYGPVIPSLYSKVKDFRGNPINTELFSDEVGDFEISSNHEKVINQVMQIYGKYDGIQLSTLTHREGTPWSNTIQGAVIPNELIKKHFDEMVSQNKKD